MAEQQHDKTSIAREVRKYVSAIDSLAKTVETAMDSLEITHQTAHKLYDSYVAEHGEVSRRDGHEYVKMRSHEYCHGYGVVSRELERIHAAQYVVPQSFLVALVSRYDALLGGLIRVFFQIRPEALKSSERVFTFSELAQFDSIDNAREFLIEKEIESVLRKSHPEQFEWLEKKFEIQLRKDLPAWPVFVEITERRNLFVHADGVVSAQYLSNCRTQGVELDRDINRGTSLTVNQTYFRKAHRTLFEMGVKLAQVLWRKVVPTAIKDADCELMFLTDELLYERRYEFAKTLLDFADTTLAKRHASEWYRLLFLLNRALAYRLSGDKGRCREILRTQDWSAVDDTLRLAHKVLMGDFEEAGRLMRKIGKTDDPRIGMAGGPHKGDYLHSPLFLEFRKTDLFVNAFAEIFGDDRHEERLLSNIRTETKPN